MFPRRTVVFGALVPAFAFSTAAGAVIPIIAPFAVQQGASLAVAGLTAALLPIGQILADIPAGALAARIGDRRAMLLAGSLAALSFIAVGALPSLATLAVAILLVGASSAVFQLARHSYLTGIVPANQRARVLSTLGGVHRIGQFVGPFLGAGVTAAGDLRLVFPLATLASVMATLTVLLAKPERGARSPKRTGADAAASAPHHAAAGRRAGLRRSAGRRGPGARQSLRSILSEHRRLLATLGIAGVLVGAVRGARQQVIPLWGEAIGVDPATISLIYGLAGGVDMLLFYPAGKVMDRFGRLWIAVPGMLALGLSMAAIPFTSSAAGLAAVGLVLGFSNGLGSGIMMTIASDVAPERSRPQFLGVWRLLQDIGLGIGPLLLAGGAALGSLSLGIWVAAAMGGPAAAGMQRWLPRFSVHANGTTRRRAGL